VPSRGPSSNPDAGPPPRRPRLALALATAGGAGYAPKAPGTAGAAVGVVLALALARWGMLPYTAAAAVLLAVGIWAAGEAERAFARHDDGRIVIDEVVGQLVALLPLAACGPFGAARDAALAVAGFAAFRLFDIWKPGPVRWAERLAGGTGVMADDVVAGALGAALVGGLAVALRGGGA
jgi:phosphatidylglycerophosphatase A